MASSDPLARPASKSARASKQTRTFVEGNDRIAEGDTELVLDILPPELAETAFERMRQEVQWQVMKHRGGEVPRLVAQEGEVGSDGRYVQCSARATSYVGHLFQFLRSHLLLF